MASENRIGEYLRARRQLVLPEDAGLPGLSGRRRVAGLRRAEVALLAGVSTDYYIRLEQGRDHNPSPQVLDALARALQLDDDATQHLHDLAAVPARRRRRTAAAQKVPTGIVQLIDSWDGTPAYVLSRHMDVLAANSLATALAPYYAVGHNLVRTAFLDPRVQDMHAEWERITESMAAGLRALVGPDTDDPRLNELVGELSVRSERFRRLWARHDVRPKRPGPLRIEHPQVGTLQLTYEKLPIPDTDGQELTIYQADPGSRSAQSLALLASMTAERDAADPGRRSGPSRAGQLSDEPLR